VFIGHLYIYLCIYFGGTEAWTNDLTLVSQALYYLSLLALLLDTFWIWLLLLFLWYWGLNSEPIPSVTPPALSCDGFIWDRVLWTICHSWLQTMVLLISASWVARIIGMKPLTSGWFGYFWGKVGHLHLSLPGLWSSYFYASHVAGMTDTYPPCSVFCWLIWHLTNILSRLALTHDPPDLHFWSS
jgi:hypothetical protein